LIADGFYGFSVRSAPEIIRLQNITPVPPLPDHVRGVINLRGPVIPLIDRRMKWGLVAEANSRTCVVVGLVDSSAGPARSMGLIVDPVDEVTTITPAEIEPIPEFGGPIDRSRLLVLAKVKGQVKTLLSIEQVIKTGRDSAIAPPLPPFRRAANNTPELATKTILAADAALITPKKSRERSGVDLLCNSIRAPPLVEAQRIRQSISQLGVGESFDRPKVTEEFRPSGDRRNSTLYKTIPVVAAGDAAGRTAPEDGLNFRAAKHQSRRPTPPRRPFSMRSTSPAPRITSGPSAPPTPSCSPVS
jgi:purine-binding chemotaxis protein CheW